MLFGAIQASLQPGRLTDASQSGYSGDTGQDVDGTVC